MKVYDTVRQDSVANGDTVPVAVSFVGDILLAQSVGRLAQERGTEYLFDGVRTVIAEDDLTVGNLEGPAATAGTAAKMRRYTFRADPGLLPGLRSAGIEAVSLANNHSLDYGRQALLETVDNLRATGIAFAGAGANLDSAARPMILSARTCTLAVLCFSRMATRDQFAGRSRSGVATAYDPARLLREIARARLRAQAVAVFLHWGEENSTAVLSDQRRLARLLIDAGADLVVGTHPHVVQGFEYYRGKLIAYSLGNFVFTNRDSRQSLILQTRWRDGRMLSAEAVPCRIPLLRPVIVPGETARRAEFSWLAGQSEKARVDETGAVLPLE